MARFLFMEEQQQNNTVGIPTEKPKGSYWKFVAGFFVLVILTTIGIVAFGDYMQKQDVQKNRGVINTGRLSPK